MVDQQVDALNELVSSLDVSSMTGQQAARLVTFFSKGEKLCAAAKAMCAARVADTGQYQSDGARDAATWLAGISGDSRSAAGDLLETTRHLDKLPRLRDAFRSGELSGKQAHEVARAASLDPTSEDQLLQAAQTSSLNDLREKADRVAAAARSREDDEARHRRIHAQRHLRTWSASDGAFMGRFALTPEAGARLMGPLSQIADAIFEQAWSEGRKESRDAYMADALVALAGGSLSEAGSAVARQELPGGKPGPAGPASTGGQPSGSHPVGVTESAPSSKDGGRQARSTRRSGCFKPDYQVIMRIDLEALVRGHLAPGEESSIDGVGHVPVSVVQSYLDAAKVRLVVTDGVDIRSIYSFKRNVRKALDTALYFRDRTCVVPGCDSSFHLERDHIKEFAKNGPTTLENMCRLCPAHHRMKSNHGFVIEGGPGRWRWLRPDGTPAGAWDQPDSISSRRTCIDSAGPDPAGADGTGIDGAGIEGAGID